MTKNYHTFGTIPKSRRKIPHFRDKQNLGEKYNTFGTILKSKRKISHFRYNSKI